MGMVFPHIMFTEKMNAEKKIVWDAFVSKSEYTAANGNGNKS